MGAVGKPSIRCVCTVYLFPSISREKCLISASLIYFCVSCIHDICWLHLIASAASLKDDDLSQSDSRTSQKAATAAAGEAERSWWLFAGSPGAAVAVLSGAAAGIAFTALKLTGH